MGRRSPDAARSSATAPEDGELGRSRSGRGGVGHGGVGHGPEDGGQGYGVRRGPDRAFFCGRGVAFRSREQNGRKPNSRTPARFETSQRTSERTNEHGYSPCSFVRSLVRAAHRRSVGSPAAFLKNPRPQEYRRTPRRRRRREKNGLSCSGKPAITKRDTSTRQHVPRRPMLN